MRKNKKKSKKDRGDARIEEELTPPKPRRTTRKPLAREAPHEPSQPSGRRTHEAFGIITLAVALLLGPSLVSVQFGEGLLMGPFGHAVGTALNQVLGIAGYVLVLALLAVALRVFASGLEPREEGDGGAPPRQTLWRERLGLVLLTLSVAALVHLAARPHRLDGASLGGLVGEISAEILCGLASTAGAWVLWLAGLAVALLLTTSLSWVRLGLVCFRWSRRWAGNVWSGLGGSARRFRSMTAGWGELLRRREVATEAGGAAALPPPIVRLDLCPLEELPAPEAAPAEAPCTMPRDLEIGRRVAVEPLISEPRPLVAPAGEVEEEAAAPEPGGSSQPEPAAVAPGGAEEERWQDAAADTVPLEALLGVAPDGDRPPLSAAEVLTIVEPHYREEASPAPAEAEAAERRVEQTDGPGFVLHGDTYRPPPLSLLEYEASTESNIDKEAIYRQAERLVQTLADYKIMGRVTEVHPGPVVTMYEFVPAAGTRISKIANLANDLAMSLAALRVRIVAPIPGKGAVGIEVPNDRRETVYFKEIVAHDTFRKSKSGLALAMGKNIVGAPVAMDLARMPHLLVAGATGAGKSVSINTMICSLLLKNSPEEVRMIMVDPKHLELSGYNDIPHLLLPVVTDPKKANIALRWAVNEMERRYQLLADMKVRDIVSYNRKVDKLREREEERDEPEPARTEEEASGSQQGAAGPNKILVVRKNEDGSEEPVGPVAPVAIAEGEPLPAEPRAAEVVEATPKRRGPRPRRLPFIVVVIDEFADLMMVASKEVETSVARLAQKARAAGIHVILATQRPSVDVITGLIKANFPSRVSFQVASGHDSKTILGCQGAENLLGSGDMLVLDRGAEMKRLHGAYISDEEIRRIVDWLKEQGRPIYDMEILKPREDEEEGAEAEEQVDEMYDQAVALVAETRQASISMIQRRLRVGYNRAARMVERMEREGIVTPPDGVKGREVLIQHHV